MKVKSGWVGGRLSSRVGNVSAGVEMLSGGHGGRGRHSQTLAGSLQQGDSVQSLRPPLPFNLLFKPCNCARLLGGSLPHSLLHQAHLLPTGDPFTIGPGEVNLFASYSGPHSHSEILLWAKVGYLFMALNTKPEGGCLAWPETHNLLVLESKLLPCHVKVGLGHQPTESHPNFEVKLLASVHAHCCILVRPCQVVVCLDQLRNS